MKKLFLTGFGRRKANPASVEEALSTVNGSAAAHTIGTFGRVAEIAERAERHLDAMEISKRLRPGARATYVPAGPTAGAYRYAVVTTMVVVERSKSGWYLVDVVREEAYPKQAARFALTVTDEAAISSVEKCLAWMGRTLDSFDRTRRQVPAERARA